MKDSIMLCTQFPDKKKNLLQYKKISSIASVEEFYHQRTKIYRINSSIIKMKVK